MPFHSEHQSCSPRSPFHALPAHTPWIARRSEHNDPGYLAVPPNVPGRSVTPWRCQRHEGVAQRFQGRDALFELGPMALTLAAGKLPDARSPTGSSGAQRRSLHLVL